MMQKLLLYLASQQLPPRLLLHRRQQHLRQRDLPLRLRLVPQRRKPQWRLLLHEAAKPTRMSALPLSELRKQQQLEAWPRLDPMTATSIKDAAVLCGARLLPS